MSKLLVVVVLLTGACALFPEDEATLEVAADQPSATEGVVLTTTTTQSEEVPITEPVVVVETETPPTTTTLGVITTTIDVGELAAGYQREINSLATDLDVAQRRIQVLSQQLGEAEGLATRRGQSLTQAQSEVSRLTDVLQRETARANRLQEDLTIARAQLATATTNLAALQGVARGRSLTPEEVMASLGNTQLTATAQAAIKAAQAAQTAASQANTPTARITSALIQIKKLRDFFSGAVGSGINALGTSVLVPAEFKYLTQTWWPQHTTKLAQADQLKTETTSALAAARNALNQAASHATEARRLAGNAAHQASDIASLAAQQALAKVQSEVDVAVSAANEILYRIHPKIVSDAASTKANFTEAVDAKFSCRTTPADERSTARPWGSSNPVTPASACALVGL